MEKEQQELMYKLSMFEQQMQHMQQQLQAVEQGIMELTSLNLGLEDLNGSKGKDILAPIGRGIFAKAKLQSEDLIVDIGSKNLVKKSIKETQKIISEQTHKLDDVKRELNNNLEHMNNELTQTFLEAQKKEEKGKK